MKKILFILLLTAFIPVESMAKGIGARVRSFYRPSSARSITRSAPKAVPTAKPTRSSPKSNLPSTHDKVEQKSSIMPFVTGALVGNAIGSHGTNAAPVPSQENKDEKKKEEEKEKK